MITIRDVIQTTWKEYVGHFPAWAKLVVPVAAVSLIYSIADEFYTKGKGAQEVFTFSTPPGWPPGIYAAAGIVLTLAYVWMNVVVILNADRVLGGTQINAETTYKLGWQKVVNAFFVSVMYALIVLGGLILLIVPGIIFALRYSLALQSAVLEDKRGWNAMRRSAELTQGRYASVFSLYLVPNLVFGIGIAVVAGIPAIIASFTHVVIFSGFTMDGLLERLILSGIDAIVGTLSFPLGLLVAVLAFRTFRDTAK